MKRTLEELINNPYVQFWEIDKCSNLAEFYCVTHNDRKICKKWRSKEYIDCIVKEYYSPLQMLKKVKHTKDFILEIISHALDITSQDTSTVDFSDYLRNLSDIEDLAIQYANELDHTQYQSLIKRWCALLESFKLSDEYQRYCEMTITDRINSRLSYKGKQFEQEVYDILKQKCFQERLNKANDMLLNQYTTKLANEIDEIKRYSQIQIDSLNEENKSKQHEIDELKAIINTQNDTIRKQTYELADQEEKIQKINYNEILNKHTIEELTKTIDEQNQIIHKYSRKNMISSDFGFTTIDSTLVSLKNNPNEIIKSLLGKGIPISDRYTLKLKLDNKKYLNFVNSLTKGKIVDIDRINLHNMPNEANKYVIRLLTKSFPNEVKYLNVNINYKESTVKMVDISNYFEALLTAIPNVANELVINSFIMSTAQMNELVTKSHHIEKLTLSNIMISDPNTIIDFNSDIAYKITSLSFEGSGASEKCDWNSNIAHFENLVNAIGKSKLKSSLKMISFKNCGISKQIVTQCISAAEMDGIFVDV